MRYRASVLGLGWSYVKPAVQFAVYFVGMGLLLDQRAIGDYAVYLFGGLAVVTTFSEAVGNATRSVVVNGDLVRKIYLPRGSSPCRACALPRCTSHPSSSCSASGPWPPAGAPTLWASWRWWPDWSSPSPWRSGAGCCWRP